MGGVPFLVGAVRVPSVPECVATRFPEPPVCRKDVLSVSAKFFNFRTSQEPVTTSFHPYLLPPAASYGSYFRVAKRVQLSLQASFFFFDALKAWLLSALVERSP